MKPVVIVPYRDRAIHLKVFAPAIKNYLDCDLLIVEQADDKPFNRGALLNVGFIEANPPYYYIFHDVDMIPINADYSYPENPTHIATQCSQFNYMMPYPEYFGGVNLFTHKQFTTINGFVNNLKGWGAEDDILRESVIRKGLKIDRRLCKFESLHHERHIDPKNHRYNCEIMRKPRDFNNGLSSLRYVIVETINTDLYKHIKVEMHD